jgi:hypothetical protein
MPIVRIPTNIIARTIQSAVGLEVGMGKLAVAYAKGIKELPQEHADLIMRQIKAGSIGSAFLLYGYFNASQFGGFYQQGEKRKPGELKAGEMKIVGLVIPVWAQHRQEFLVAQLGATIYNASHSKIHKKDMETAGLGEGALAGLLGLTGEVPFVRQMEDTTKVFNKYDRQNWLGRQANSLVNPQLEQWIAAHTDRDAAGNLIQRKPETIMQNIEAGIPGLRETVPAKKSRAMSQ